MRWILTPLLIGTLVTPLAAQSPVPIEKIATVSEIEQLIQKNAESLGKLLEDESKFEELKGKGIREDFGMLALLGQSLAESPGNKDSKINGPALRDAALAYDRKGDHAAAKAAYGTVQSVLGGTVTGEHAELHPWNKLINMHPMMEEMNSGNSAILKVVKKPRGKADEVLPAVAWGLLAVAMKADTHEVKNPDELPQWDAWSDDFLASSLKLAEAIRAKDAEEGRKWFDKANETCDACHEQFRKD
ncbi:hypothetical protein SH661x_004438 [Planctomicrobium sp. SH661]|uniref:hypothetical protein n=1 Tax=Planctomicrobium sp. SH661 TaxID=3448124 RepID=UPI003F5B80A2